MSLYLPPRFVQPRLEEKGLGYSGWVPRKQGMGLAIVGSFEFDQELDVPFHHRDQNDPR
jgi:hypothetical protein